jgi:murein DD-endopeptidase MepM/ murein hydrolase activator NlpD
MIGDSLPVQRLTPLAAILLALVILAGSGCDPGTAKDSTGERAEVAVEEDSEITTVGEEDARGLALHLPTSNDALLRGDKSSFYQALDATIPDLRPFGWMGGQYGFVRNQARSPSGLIFTRVHQGVDIRPVYRDPSGVPLDTVRAIDDGRVAYVNRGARASSYGIYVVIEHDWEGTPVYSLMAHLSSAWVRAGDVVAAGAPVGRMGYTGSGLSRHRAHLHLEVALMLNRHYQPWHNRFFGSRNSHGLFMGRNLIGVNPSSLLLQLQENPSLTFSEFVRSKPVAYRLALPGGYPLDILERYPWLGDEGVTAAAADPGGSWLVSFSREGVPVRIGRATTPVAEPMVVFVADEIRREHLSTGGYVVRGSDGYQLSRNGRAYAALMAAGPRGVPDWF